MLRKLQNKQIFVIFPESISKIPHLTLKAFSTIAKNFGKDAK